MADPELALVFGEPWCKIWIGDNGNRIVAYWARDHQFLNCANVVVSFQCDNSFGIMADSDPCRTRKASPQRMTMRVSERSLTWSITSPILHHTSPACFGMYYCVTNGYVSLGLTPDSRIASPHRSAYGNSATTSNSTLGSRAAVLSSVTQHMRSCLVSVFSQRNTHAISDDSPFKPR